MASTENPPGAEENKTETTAAVTNPTDITPPANDTTNETTTSYSQDSSKTEIEPGVSEGSPKNESVHRDTEPGSPPKGEVKEKPSEESNPIKEIDAIAVATATIVTTDILIGNIAAVTTTTTAPSEPPRGNVPRNSGVHASPKQGPTPGSPNQRPAPPPPRQSLTPSPKQGPAKTPDPPPSRTTLGENTLKPTENATTPPPKTEAKEEKANAETPKAENKDHVSNEKPSESPPTGNSDVKQNEETVKDKEENKDKDKDKEKCGKNRTREIRW